MQYIVYKTTNLVNGKYYIGFHTTKDYTTPDKYLGSGVRICSAIKKYGRQNFKRETIAVFSNKFDALKFEYDYLNLIDYSNDQLCYNIAMGGESLGSWAVENGVGIHAATKEQLSEWGKIGSKTIVDNKLGYHGLTHEEKSILCKERDARMTPEARSKRSENGGKAGGILSRDKKAGIHGMTHEQMSKRSKDTVSKFDPQYLIDQGKMMGTINKGSICYTDGINYWRYSKAQQDIMSFDRFLKENSQFRRGKISRSLNKQQP